MRRREGPIEEQKRVNEEKNRNTHRQETEVATERQKVGEGTIRKMGTQGEIDTKSKPAEEKKEGQKNY